MKYWNIYWILACIVIINNNIFDFIVLLGINRNKMECNTYNKCRALCNFYIGIKVKWYCIRDKYLFYCFTILHSTHTTLSDGVTNGTYVKQYSLSSFLHYGGKTPHTYIAISSRSASITELQWKSKFKLKSLARIYSSKNNAIHHDDWSFCWQIL